MVDIEIERAGTFSFYVQFQNGEEGPRHNFIVNPQLRINDVVTPLDALCCQTHLTRCLGPLSEWRARLKLASECGFNAVHLTPIQVRFCFRRPTV